MRDLGWSTQADDLSDAGDYFAEHVSEYIEENFRKKGVPIPMPSAPRGPELDALLIVPIKAEARIRLWNLLREKHMSTSEFARQVGVSRQQAQFMVDGTRPVSIDAYCKAFEVLGYYPSLQLDRYR